jgi:6-phosphogluconolactonase
MIHSDRRLTPVIVASSTLSADFHDAEALARGVAEWMCALARAQAGAFAVCLSGGSTPRRLYEVLAEPAVAPRFPWDRAHWFWGDERFVPHDHPESNYRMARDALFSRVAVPEENIHPIPTEGLSPQQAAAEYEAELKRYYGAEALAPDRPLFDLALLGIGDDGHTASLFPGHAALDEKRRWALAVIGAKPEPRITLTLPPLASSRDLAFLATGAEKKEIVRRAQSGDRALPAGRVRPVGRLHWFTDRGAASE